MKISEAIERLQKHQEEFGDQEIVFYTPEKNKWKEWKYMLLSESEDVCEVMFNAD